MRVLLAWPLDGAICDILQYPFRVVLLDERAYRENINVGCIQPLPFSSSSCKMSKPTLNSPI
jgi:hypothetical protein